jgi:hypothetical protein
VTAMNEDPGRPGGSSGELPDGLSEEVRRRLHDAVADIQPAPGALERLRVAVPARRRRRRAAGATALATVAVLAIATPVVRTAVLSDQTSQKSAKTSSQSSAGGGQNDQGENDDDQESRGTIGSSGVAGSNGNGAKPRTTGGPQATATTTAVIAPILPTTTATATASPTATATSTLPPGAQACEVNDLEQGSGTTLAAPGSDGIAYGAVEVRNVSRRDCTVAGAGIVLVAAAPGNPPVQVQVKFHETGDLAVRLPSVAAPTGPLTVKAGAAYEFQFAWLPTRGTGANGSCTPGDGQAGPPPPIPSLAYMLADGGVKMAEVPLTPACGGVVYRTEVYPVGVFPRAAG